MTDEFILMQQRVQRKTVIKRTNISGRQVLQARVGGKILTQVYTRGKKQPGKILNERIREAIKRLPTVIPLTHVIEVSYQKRPRSFKKRFGRFRISASFAVFYKGKPVGVFWGSSVALPIEADEQSMIEDAKLNAAGRAMQKIGLIQDSDTDEIPEGMSMKLLTKRWVIYRDKKEKSRFAY